MTAPSLHDDIEEDREGEQRCRRRIDRESQNRDCTCGKQKPESERLSTRYSDVLAVNIQIATFYRYRLIAFKQMLRRK